MNADEQFWSISGTSKILEPGESETLLEWICPQNSAALLTSYDIGMEASYEGAPSGGYIKLPHSDLDVELCFQRIHPDMGHTIHLSPNKFIQHHFTVAVKLVVTNKTDDEITVWGLLKGKIFPRTSAAAQVTPTPAVTPTPDPVSVPEEEIMTPDVNLDNSHFDMPKMVPTSLGVFNKELPTHEEGDIASLQMDNRGRLLVAVDGVSEAAQQQIIQLKTIESELVIQLTDKANVAYRDQQRITNEQTLSLRKIALKRDKSGDARDESMSRTDKRAKTVISGRRYAFFATFVRWAAVAGAAITMTYLLV